jgi:hypothetical protein
VAVSAVTDAEGLESDVPTVSVSTSVSTAAGLAMRLFGAAAGRAKRVEVSPLEIAVAIYMASC